MYPFPPSPEHRAFGNHPYVWWDGAFSDEDFDRLEELASKIDPVPATIGQGQEDHEYRLSDLRWIRPEGWLADKMSYVARMLNGQYFGFDLWGFGEAFQHTTYTAPKEYAGKTITISAPDVVGHYDWHIDIGPGDFFRKLSLVLMVNDDYEGGDLQIRNGAEPLTVEKKKGRVYAFPSYVLHRVTAVTKGKRISLVSWVSGPKFR